MSKLKIPVTKEIRTEDFRIGKRVYTNYVNVCRLVEDPKNIYLYAHFKTGVITVARIVLDGSYTEKKAHVEATNFITKYGAKLRIIFCECGGYDVDDMVDTIFGILVRMSISEDDPVISNRMDPMTIYDKEGFVKLIRRYVPQNQSSVAIKAFGVLSDDDAANAIIQMIYLWCEHAEVTYVTPYINVSSFLLPPLPTSDAILGHKSLMELAETAAAVGMPEVMQRLLIVNVADVLVYAEKTLLDRARENGLFLMPEEPKPFRRKKYSPPRIMGDEEAEMSPYDYPYG